jgi:tetratricopeptide (TPR) repeat protein
MLDSLTEDEKKTWAKTAARLVYGVFPFDINDPKTWEKTSLLLPNALASSKHSEELRVALEETSLLINGAGRYFRQRAEFQDAETAHRRALRIDEAIYGTDHPNVARDVNNLGLVLRDMGKLDEAKKCFERALKINEAVYGTDHPSMAIRINNLGGILQDLGELDEAKKCFDRALKVDEAVYGTDHPNVGIVSTTWVKSYDKWASSMRQRGASKGLSRSTKQFTGQTIPTWPSMSTIWGWYFEILTSSMRQRSVSIEL